MSTNSSKKVLTRKQIRKLAEEIREYLIKKYLWVDVSIYFNGIRFTTSSDNKHFYYNDREHLIEEKYADPSKISEYMDGNILCMTFEGDFYDIINEGGSAKFTNIINKYGLYYEQGDSWNLSLCPIDDNMEIEPCEDIKIPQKKKEPIYLDQSKIILYPSLKSISDIWQEFTKKVGDVGSCVLGAGFSFEYEGESFFLPPHSYYQGSIAWETDKDKIKQMLQLIGCENIQYHWGNLD